MPDPTTEQKHQRLFDDQASDAPPRIRVNRVKIYVLIACSTILTLLLLIVVLNIDTGAPAPRTETTIDDVTELIPKALTDQERQGLSFDRDRFAPPEMPDGGAIEVANDDGTLAQEYRFKRLNPKPQDRPPGWVEMVEPFAVIYAANGRIFTLKGDVAQANTPHRALESGVLTGNVLIEMYQGHPGQRFVRDSLEPSLVVKTDEASFDNMIGEIRCEGSVDITSTTVDLLGNGMRLQINDQEDITQLLEMQRIRYILLHAAQESAAPRTGQVAADVDPSPDASPSSDGEPALTAASPARSLDETQFYRLTLSDRVKIVQDDPVTGRVGSGDELTIVFSFESEGFDGTFALGAPRPVPGRDDYWASGPMTRETWLLSLAFAAQFDGDLPPIGKGDTLITCAGPLKMVPLKEHAERPVSARDARLTITGAPVVMKDLAAQTVARCGSFIYATENDRLQMTRSAEHPVQFQTPDYEAEGEHLWIDQSLGEGHFEGSGWLASRSRPEPIDSLPAANQDPGASNDARKDAPTNPVERMRVTWQGGVHLEFQQTGQSQRIGPMEKATFRDAVQVRGDEGTIDCGTLDLTFRQNDLDETVPQSMTASGEARLRSFNVQNAENPEDGAQTIWADLVHVTFAESAPDDESINEVAASSNPFGEDTQVETLRAEGDVQLLMADGTRIFADSLDGNAQQEEVTLLGENIVFISGPVIIERGTKVHMVKSEGTADWPGAGMARIFMNPIDVTADRRIERPDIRNDDPDNPRQVRSMWNESMHFDGAFNDGAGRIVLTGAVDTNSTPSPLETTSMTSASQELQFVVTEKSAEETDPATPRPTGLLDDASRRLGKLIARGDARIESRRRYADAPDLKPRLFYIAGEFIEYDDRTFEALVEGPGDLLVRDERADDDATTDETVPFSNKGITGFSWTERFQMKHVVDDYYEMTMRGDVTGLHQDLDGQSSQITGDQLVAGVTRTEAAERSASPTGELVLGSGMDLRQVRGRGGIFMRTPTRDVTCQELEYNLLTNLAHASAARGGRVTVKTRGEPNPIFAERIDWNLATDRIEVLRGSGSAGRP